MQINHRLQLPYLWYQQHHHLGKHRGNFCLGISDFGGHFSRPYSSSNSVCWKEYRLVHPSVSLALAGTSSPISGVKKEHWLRIREQCLKAQSCSQQLCELGTDLCDLVSSSWDFSALALFKFGLETSL